MRIKGGKKTMARFIFEGYSIHVIDVNGDIIEWDYSSISDGATFKNIYNWDSITAALEGVEKVIEIVENRR